MPESPRPPAAEPNAGENLFQQICNLGVGRLYSSRIQITKAKPASSDIVGRLENLANGSAEVRMNLAIPFAVSLPVNREETQHILVFQNGSMALVQVLNPSGNIESYRQCFDSRYGGIRSLLDFFFDSNLGNIDLCLNKLRTETNNSAVYDFTLLDPLDSDKNVETVLNALTQAKKIASELRAERAKRQADLLTKAFGVLSEE